jgi:hypothetical protein
MTTRTRVTLAALMMTAGATASARADDAASTPTGTIAPSPTPVTAPAAAPTTRVRVDGASRATLGFYGSVGFEALVPPTGLYWSSPANVTFHLGLGMQYLARTQVTSGASTVTVGGSLEVLIEAGLRYMFL